MSEGIAESNLTKSSHHEAETESYELAATDWSAIQTFEFRLANNLWVLRDAIGWVAEAPQGKVLQENIAKLADYFGQRQQAMEAALPQLTASQNPDVQAMAEPVRTVSGQLTSMVQEMRTYLETRTPEAALTLQRSSRVICDAMKASSQDIGTNPAYRAYRESQPEDKRVTIEFDLEYDETA